MVDIRELRQQLEKADRWILKEVHQALYESAYIMYKHIKPRIPIKSGEWSGSLTWGATGTTRGWVQWRNPVYAGVNEFGGNIPNPGHHGTHLHKPVLPSGYFVYPGLRAALPEAVPRFEEAVIRTMTKAGFLVTRGGMFERAAAAA